MTGLPEPGSTDDLRGLLLDYLDYYRGVVLAKLEGLDPDGLTTSRVPSGWTPAGLANHLAFMERRWLQWGFAGEPVDEPWGDRAGDGWVTPADGAAGAAHRLALVAARTREIVEAHELTAPATPGGRFASAADAPQLQWVLLHVLQEYARHAGHLDVVRELTDGATGETG